MLSRCWWGRGRRIIPELARHVVDTAPSRGNQESNTCGNSHEQTTKQGPSSAIQIPPGCQPEKNPRGGPSSDPSKVPFRKRTIYENLFNGLLPESERLPGRRQEHDGLGRGRLKLSFNPLNASRSPVLVEPYPGARSRCNSLHLGPVPPDPRSCFCHRRYSNYSQQEHKSCSRALSEQLPKTCVCLHWHPEFYLIDILGPFRKCKGTLDKSSGRFCRITARRDCRRSRSAFDSSTSERANASSEAVVFEL